MSEEWKHASWVSSLGKWAWVIIIINGILGIIVNIILIAEIVAIYANLPGVSPPIFWNVWGIIWAILIILVAFAIIRPNFSEKCAAKDWDNLYNWFLNIGDIKIPWMLIWGIIIEGFGWYWWGGLPILIPALVLIFAGPKPYEWKVEV